MDSGAGSTVKTPSRVLYLYWTGEGFFPLIGTAIGPTYTRPTNHDNLVILQLDTANDRRVCWTPSLGYWAEGRKGVIEEQESVGCEDGSDGEDEA